MKAYKYLTVLMVVIVALPLAGRLFWLMKRSKNLDILVVNKSVTKSKKNEAKALNWTLNFEKFVDSLGDSYDYEYDYFGYFPDAVTEDRKIKSYKLEEISLLTENYEAAIFLDNKGIDNIFKGNGNSKNKVYGGFNQNDYFLLKEMLGKQKLVIGEYNFFSPPTEELVRYNTEQFLDIYSLGWNGKFFNNLSKEKIAELIPSEWFDVYQQGYTTEWDFTGSGIILLNQGQKRIIVIPSKKYMSSEFPTVNTTEENASEYNIPLSVAYDGWFDVAFEGKNKVVSNFNLNLNQDGIDLLNRNGIKSEFPAVIESVNKKFYYMAGDFSKVQVSLLNSRLGFISHIIRSSKKGKTQNPNKFFRVYYDQLLSGILNDYHKEISGSEK
jgi:hypothetical protein